MVDTLLDVPQKRIHQNLIAETPVSGLQTMLACISHQKIENASAQHPAPSPHFSAEAFPIKARDDTGVGELRSTQRRLWAVVHPRLSGACKKGLGTFLTKAHVGLPKALGFPYCGVCGNQTLFARASEIRLITQASLRDLRLYVRRSNRLSLLTAGLRVYESQEGLAVIRIDRCELHPDSLSSFRPPHYSFRAYSGQFGRPTKDQVILSADREHFFRTEADPRFAHVLSLRDVIRIPCRKDDSQRYAEP
jgi:hypothetical protein